MSLSDAVRAKQGKRRTKFSLHLLLRLEVSLLELVRNLLESLKLLDVRLEHLVVLPALASASRRLSVRAVRTS